MKFDLKRMCVVADDGSLLRSSWVNVRSTCSSSVMYWGKARYIKFLRDGARHSEKDSIDNTHLWTR